MTESPGIAPEPTPSDLLAAIRDNAAATAALSEVVRQGFGLVMTELAGVKADVASVKTDIADLKAGQDQLRAEVAELKVEIGLVEARVDDAHRAILRHANDGNPHPNAA